MHVKAIEVNDERACLTGHPKIALRFNDKLMWWSNIGPALSRKIRQRSEVSRNVSPGDAVAERSIRIEQHFKTATDDVANVTPFDSPIAACWARVPRPR